MGIGATDAEGTDTGSAQMSTAAVPLTQSVIDIKGTVGKINFRVGVFIV